MPGIPTVATLGVVIAAAAPPPPSVDVFSPLVIVTGNGVQAMVPGSTAPIVINKVQNPNGSVEVTAAGGKTSVVHFGPGLAQSFVGDAGVFAFGRADVGHVRLAFDSRARSPPRSTPLRSSAPSVSTSFRPTQGSGWARPSGTS